MTSLSSHTIISVCLLVELTVSLVSGQTLAGDIVSPTGTAGDLTGRVLSFTEVGTGAVGSLALQCRPLPTTNVVWQFPNGTTIPSGTGAAATSSQLFTDVDSNRVALRRGPEYFSPDGQYCCVRTTTNERRCVYLTACPTLNAVSQGMVTYDATSNTASTTCNAGAALEHNTPVVCNEDTMMWSTAQPSCPLINCGLPPEVVNAAYTTPSRTTFGGTVTYICNAGYETPGRVMTVIATCQEDGAWGPLPTCQAITCPSPPTVPNGSPGTPTSVELGGTVEYTCNSGYEISPGVNMATATCRFDRSWGPLRTCTGVPCGPPPSIDNGSRTFSGTQYQNTAAYNCNTGYQLSGSATVTCQADMTWTTPPICIATCPDLTLTNGMINYSPSTTPRLDGTVATHSCDTGYELSGGTTRICQSDRTWSEGSITCQRVSCGSPPSIDNGSRTFSGTQYQDTATYSCDTGYQPSASATVTCQADRTWTMPSTCIATCPDITLANGMISYSPNTTPRLDGTVATHSCDTGYELSGGTQRTCQSDRTWSGGNIICEGVSCGSPPSISNGSPGTPTSTTFGGTVIYSCDPGYNLTGCAVAECLSNRGWSCVPFCADNQMIQLKVGPARHCEEWTEEKVELMYKFMNASIFRAIQSSDHVIPKENIQRGYFSCYRSITETTYRTTITGTERVSAVDYAALIQQWLDSGVTTRVLWYVIKFDKTCPVSISSVEEEECQ